MVMPRHLNLVRARLLRGAQPLEDFRWSSYGNYLRPARQRPVWLRVDRWLVSLKWIAAPLAMGSGTHVSNLLGAERKRESLKSES
jgi:hypothetical protein